MRISNAITGAASDAETGIIKAKKTLKLASNSRGYRYSAIRQARLKGCNMMEVARCTVPRCIKAVEIICMRANVSRKKGRGPVYVQNIMKCRIVVEYV